RGRHRRAHQARRSGHDRSDGWRLHLGRLPDPLVAMTHRLETARLRMRPYELADFDAYAAMWQEPAVVRFIGGVPFTREQSWTRFLRQVGMWQLMGFGFFAIEDKATGAIAGECGFH